MSIHLLAPEIADAIAAGEVVERPASVVKELVENSLDAGARRVVIEVSGAGRTLIRVADDGAGIPAGELALAFRRHATSKLSSIADLATIGSLGFRGEALASIAAVADVEARSGGHRVRVRAAQVVEEGVAPPVPGAIVEVRDLFGATPARLRFLKSPATENAAMVKVVTAYAAAYPEVAFRLLVEGRAALTTTGDGDRARVAAAAWGKAVLPELLAVAWTSGADGPAIGVAGIASQPRLSRGSRDGILLSANRRPIASRALSFAVEDAYRGSLEKGRFPVVAIDVDVAPDALDVNVHPTKREVRFHQEGAVFAAVQGAVRSALAGSEPYRFAIPAIGPMERRPALQMRLAEPEAHRPAPAPAPGPLSAGADTRARAPIGPLRPVGQVQAGYLVAEGADGLVLVDQHAAHERVLFNGYLARVAAGGGPRQRLLWAETVEVEPAQMAAWSDNRDRLAALGFELEEFGPRGLRVIAAPAEMRVDGVADALRMVLSALSDGRHPGALERAAAVLACHSAVRFGDSMDPAEQRALLDQLETATGSVTCPHGRPTRLVLGWQDLKRHFRRNY